MRKQELSYKKGLISFKRGDYRKAERIWNQALSKSKSHKFKALFARELGNSFYFQENYSEAEKFYKMSLSIEKNSEVMGRLANINYYLGRYEASEKILKEIISMNISKDQVERENLILAQVTLGTVFYRQGKLGDSIRILKQVIEKKSSKDLPLSLRLKVMYSLGAIYCEQKRYKLAEKVLLKSLRLVSNDMPETKASILNNLGTLYEDTSSLEKAKKFYLEALDIRTDLMGSGNEFEIVILKNNLGHIHEKMNDFETAENYYKEALKSELKTYNEENPTFKIIKNNIQSLKRKTKEQL